MPALSSIRLLASFLACLGCCLPQAAFATEQAPRQLPQKKLLKAVADVQLSSGGLLIGSCTGSRDEPLSNATVHICQNGVRLATATTDAKGQFVVANLRGGVYEVTLGESTRLVRCWAPDTAPPHAAPQFEWRETVTARGQSPVAATLANPWVIAGIVAAAVAIPIALHDHNDDRTASGN